MRKLTLLTIILFLFSNFSYSQSEEKITPIHFVKIDVFKSLTSRLHFDYERYNGKRRALELGINIFYPNPVFSYINEDLPFNLLAFHYRGLGGEIKEKFYFTHKYYNPYIAPLLSFDYKYFYGEDIFIINGFRSSSYSFDEFISTNQSVAKLFILAGITSKLKKGIMLDIDGGVGVGYFDSYTSRDDFGGYRYSDSNRIKLGHQSYFWPQLHFSVKLAFGFQGKTK